MANQKEYKIVINGLEKAVSEVDALIKQLNQLEQRLSKVGGKELGIASKESTQLLKEQAKLAQLQTEEGRKQLQSLEKIKAENKEIAKVQKEIAQGIREEDGAYSNTLAGKRAQLSEMKKELASMDMGDTDAWSKMRDEVGKLNEEVLELEKSYGVFTRQVGAYQEATKGFANITKEAGNADKAIDNLVGSVDQLKGKQLFQVDVQGQVIQFENLSQAISELDDMAQKASAEMLALAAAGKEGTEEYEKLNAEFTEFVEKAAELERARKYSDELKDTMSSTTKELDMAVGAFESLTSVMQIGSGIAGLFGADQEKINQAINRSVQIMSIAQGAQKLFNQARQSGTALNKLWTLSLNGASKAMTSLNIATKLTAKGMNILKVAIASTGIGLLVVAIGALVSATMKWIDKNKEAARTLTSLKEAQDVYSNAMSGVYDAFEKLGVMESTTIWRLEDAKKQIQELVDTLAKDQDFYFLDGIVPEFANLEKAAKNFDMLNQQLIKYKALSVDKNSSKKEKERYAEIAVGIEAMISAYQRWIDAVAQDNANQKKKKEDELKKIEEQKKAYNEAAKELTELNIENIKDEHKRTLAELENSRKEQIAEVRKRGYLVKELEAEINKKYNAAIIAEEKRYAEARRKVLTDAYRDTYESLFDIQEHYYEQELAVLEAQDKLIERRLNSVNTISPLGDVREFKAQGDGIEEIMNLNLIAITRAVGRYQEEADNLADAMRELYIAQDITQYEKSTRQSFADYLENGVKELEDVVGELDSGVGADLKKAIDDVIGYYNNADTMMMDEPAFTEGLKVLMSSVDELVGNYQLSTDKLSDVDSDKLNTLFALWRTFSNKRINLAQQLNTRLLQIDDDYNSRLYENQQTAIQTLLDGYQGQFDELENMRMEFTQGLMTGDYDLDSIGNFAVQIQSVKKFKSEYQVLADVVKINSDEMAKEVKKLQDELDGVNDEMQELLDSVNEEFGLNLDLGIDKNAIKEKLAELSTDLLMEWEALMEKGEKIEVELFDAEATQTNLQKFGSLVKQTLDELDMNGREWAAGIATVLSAGVNIATQMAQQVVDMQYNNAMVLIERERDEIDEQLKLIEDAYEKQEEITEAHNDKIKSLEDELSTARGDRRLFLLDEINAEMQAREKSFQLQQKLAKQEEELQKKQENLEKKSEAAERKRNKANKGIMLAQAIANTALAVTNALAVQPWFLGVALASIAGAMGAVQIGTIAATKYANGGVIQGNSHATGGVKVLGGQAEVEGGEFITNKRTTSNNIALLEFINSKKTKINLSDLIEFYASGYNARTPMKFAYADGGQLPSMSANPVDIKALRNGYQDDRPIYVSVQEIEDVSKRVRNVKALAGYED